MFFFYGNNERAKAYLDFRMAKAILQGLLKAGKSKAEARATIEKLLAGKPWADEIMDELFMTSDERYRRYRKEYEDYERKQREERARKEQQRREYYWQESCRRASMGILNDAMRFFGFEDSLPDEITIKAKYRELCLKYHPDKGGDTAIFQKLQDYKDAIYMAKGMR